MPLVERGGLEVLQLCGTPEEMGWEHGVLLRERIQSAVEFFLRNSARNFRVPYRFMVAHSAGYLPHIPDSYLAEMRAMAEAADVDFNEILALNCVADIDALYMMRLHQCCNVVIGPPLTKNGLFLHGRNLDFPPSAGVVQKSAIIIERQGIDSADILTFSVTWAGFIGSFTIANSSGFSIAEIGVPARDTNPLGCPIAFLLRQCIEEYTTCEEMVEHIRSTRRTGGFNIAIADARRKDAVCVEFTGSKVASRRMSKGKLVVDDVCLCPSTARNRLTYPAGVFRYTRMLQLLNTHAGEIDERVALAILGDSLDLGSGSKGTGYNCISGNNTVQSVLFLLSERRVLVSHTTRPATDGPYFEVNL